MKKSPTLESCACSYVNVDCSSGSTSNPCPYGSSVRLLSDQWMYGLGSAGAASGTPAACINAVALAQSNKVDVTGVWIFSVESPAGKSNPTLTFKQDGEKLTGQYSSQLMGQADLTGTVKGQAIEFVVSATVQGTPIELKYTGAADV